VSPGTVVCVVVAVGELLPLEVNNGKKMFCSTAVMADGERARCWEARHRHRELLSRAAVYLFLDSPSMLYLMTLVFCSPSSGQARASITMPVRPA